MKGRALERGGVSDTERLGNRARDISQRNKEERERKKLSPNERMAESMPDITPSYDFFCIKCHVDFTSPARKFVHRLYGDAITTYRIIHDCGIECIRAVSHRDHDDYYYLSEKIALQRKTYAQEFLQAGEYGFRTLYGEAFPEYVEKQMGADAKKRHERKELGLSGESLREKDEDARRSRYFHDV